jgi:nitronate monooxygenase
VPAGDRSRRHHGWQGIAAALQLGAQAVQMGTAFLLTRESGANAAYRALLKSERARHTRVTAAISGRRARGIVASCRKSIHRRAADSCLSGRLRRRQAAHAMAVARDVHEFGAHWAGQAAALIRDG